MQKYGFIYIWRDKKHNKYYIGKHWGNEDDGYICSSSWMKQAYELRPQDFKRRILKTNINDKQVLIDEEHKWLQFIKFEELGKKYYNLQNRKFDNGTRKDSEETKRKKSLALIGNKRSLGNTARKGKDPWNKGKTGIYSEETKQKMSISRKGRTSPFKGKHHSEENKKKHSEVMKGKSPPNKGKYSINKPRVSFHKQLNRWRVRINKEGKDIHLGLFLTLEEANDYINTIITTTITTTFRKVK
jgi:hypothetical protein